MPFLSRLHRAFAIYRLAARDARTPLMSKILPIASLLYVLWPLDVMPDFLSVLGQLDDVTAVIALCLIAWHLIPKNVKQDAGKRIIDIEPKK